MAHYTGIGDSGTTSIIGRCGINKDDARIEALGSLDELNATVGVVIAFSDSAEVIKALKSVQDDLHTACAELAAAAQNMPHITERHVKRVESIIAEAEKYIEPQKSFVLPGGSKEAALMHLARTVTRRAERQLVKLANASNVNPLLLKYANRLSSLFHIMARLENKLNDVAEENPKYEFWNKSKADLVSNSSCCQEPLKK
ncbi:cob(I)yrinic acid a,c-diamide adenosyltransferase [Candidatus Woesearchaeota archaeon]|nr:cob(I)yrinic acid a,c-diamide adenosyltransferase [Candidatus Woesearchaeota archaeon]